VLSLCAGRVHTCGVNGCGTLCVPACALGGVVAGLAVARVAARRGLGLWFFIPASSLCLRTGAMGCACLGFSGVVGLVVGFGAGLVPGLGRRAVRQAEALFAGGCESRGRGGSVCAARGSS